MASYLSAVARLEAEQAEAMTPEAFQQEMRSLKDEEERERWVYCVCCVAHCHGSSAVC